MAKRYSFRFNNINNAFFSVLFFGDITRGWNALDKNILYFILPNIINQEWLSFNIFNAIFITSVTIQKNVCFKFWHLNAGAFGKGINNYANRIIFFFLSNNLKAGFAMPNNLHKPTNYELM